MVAQAEIDFMYFTLYRVRKGQRTDIRAYLQCPKRGLKMAIKAITTPHWYSQSGRSSTVADV